MPSAAGNAERHERERPVPVDRDGRPYGAAVRPLPFPL